MEAQVMNVHERLGKHILADGYPIVMDIEKSHGSYIVDENGEEYLDVFSMFASASIGYNNPHLVKHEACLRKMAVNKPTISDICTEKYAHVLDTFERVAIAEELHYAVFISVGALAAKNALNAAFDWNTRLNKSKATDKEAGKVIHFQQAIHGRSGYTLTLTNT